jgi:4-alpha-glucanotransferase
MTFPRVAGATIPLSSIRTRTGWGIGEIPDLVPCAAWIATGGMKILQILPPYELARGETSPYGARTAFGLDPMYIAVEQIEDLDAKTIDAALGADGKAELERLRGTPSVEFDAVRNLKTRLLHLAFERFRDREWSKDTERARALRTFIERESSWENDLALYVALRESHEDFAWKMWPEGERTRHPGALAAAREKHAERVLEHQYTQWIAHEQWARARAKMKELGVELMGDLPFVVGGESADVWSHADLFLHDASLGAPPDAFAPEGQDWGLPPYDWQAMQSENEGWMRARTQHAARLYDRFRLDHVVGYFRMFVRPLTEKKGHFEPRDEDAQLARGRRELGAIGEEAARGGAQVIAEDLGVIPVFVRKALAAMHLPGYRVIPWERAWNAKGTPYLDPKTFPKESVASWSTHDTAPIVGWWDELKAEEREALGTMLKLDAKATADERWALLMRTLMTSGSDLALVLAPEILNQKERINTPGTVGGANWTYRFPMTIEDLEKDPAQRRRMEMLRTVAREGGR